MNTMFIIFASFKKIYAVTLILYHLKYDLIDGISGFEISFCAARTT